MESERERIRELIKQKSVANLDVGCGWNKQPNYIGMDKRPLENVEIVHDVESFPWPMDNDVFSNVVCSHLMEHIKPWVFIDFMNEIWRVSKIGAVLAAQSPYGVNHLFCQDPTHCRPIVEATFQYFDPDYPLYQVYKPKPWKLHVGFPSWQANGLIEVVMTKRGETVEADNDE
jgi:predicted SAM-dependent methyltransferase